MQFLYTQCVPSLAEVLTQAIQEQPTTHASLAELGVRIPWAVVHVASPPFLSSNTEIAAKYIAYYAIYLAVATTVAERMDAIKPALVGRLAAWHGAASGMRRPLVTDVVKQRA